MSIEPDAVGYSDEPLISTWNSKDCILYALGVGAGATDPVGSELAFTTENTTGVAQSVLPTFPVVIPAASGWLSAIGDFDPAMLVHGEQVVELHAPLAVEGVARVVTTVTGVYDKGSGAVVATRTTGNDPATGARIYTTMSSVFIRGAGGWGGNRGPSRPTAMPEAPPDYSASYVTRPDQALLYRLSGDRNPLHSDRSFAARAGFDRPILHGLCTFGFTGRALLHTLCDSDPGRFCTMAARFSKPVFPGDTLSVDMWRTGRGEAAFRATVPSGVVIDGGRLTYRE